MSKKIAHADIYTENYNGTIAVSAIVAGYRVAQRYVGYTQREARQLFYRFVNEED